MIVKLKIVKGKQQHSGFAIKVMGYLQIAKQKRQKPFILTLLH